MSSFQIHSQLSASIRRASKLRSQLSSKSLGLGKRVSTWFRLFCTSYQIRRLKSELH
ncbi:MAG: hypothetical protein AB8B55_11460 [Mariniblastus sp.]